MKIYALRISGLRTRSGFTLVETLIFLALFSLVVTIALPLLFMAVETRLRQQTIALVEDNGAQMVQYLQRKTQDAEQILDPALGATGSILALQMPSDESNPVLFAVETGSLMLVEGDSKEQITSAQVAIQNFDVRNTSVLDKTQNALITFTVSRTIRLRAPHTYERTFSILIAPFPDDVWQGNSCGCSVPVCENGMYQWGICSEGICTPASSELAC